jgi:CDP-diacylglycerol--serine O-phosphatidyltransferase
MKHIPNLLTLINATCGVVAIYFITAQSTNGVAACILLAALCDLLDGMLARKLGVQGPLGKELDSLADVISFGVVPAFLWSSILSDYGTLDQPWAIILGGSVAASSVYRLAKFNLSSDQSVDFIGMPTPANALFALGLWIWLGRWEQWDWIVEMNADQRFTLTLVLISTLVLSAYWLNSSLTILSFKPTNNNIRRIAQAMIVLLFCVLVIFVGPLAFTITVALLPVISFAAGQLSKRKFN